jgi:predicted HicB family RNase H-like nuclease
MIFMSMPAPRRLPAARGKRITSVELSPELLKAARIYAAARGISLRELIEEALHMRLARKEATRWLR